MADNFEDIPKYSDEGSGTSGTSSGGGGGLDQSTADARYFKQGSNLSEGDPLTLQANIGLKDQSANLDLNSVSVNGQDIFENGDPQGVGTEDDVTFGNIVTVGTSGSPSQIRGNRTNYDHDGFRIQTKNEAGSFVDRIQFTTGMAFGDSSQSRISFINVDRFMFRHGDVEINDGGLSIGTSSLLGYTLNVNGTANIQNTLTGVDASLSSQVAIGQSLSSATDLLDVDGAMRAETLRTNTGTFLSPTSYAFRNAGDSGYRTISIAQATATDHAVRADRELTITAGEGLAGSATNNLTSDPSWSLSVNTVDPIAISSDNVTLNFNDPLYLNGSDLDVRNHGDGQRGVITVAEQDIYGVKTLKDNLFAEGTVGSPDFVSRTIDWQVTKEGAADFRSVYSDSIVTKAFTADVAQAFRGSRFLTKSFATVKDDGFTVPAVGSTVSVTVADVDGFSGLEVFEQDDYALVQLLDQEWQGAGTLTGEVWGEVTSSITDNGNGTQTFDFTVRDLSVPDLEGEPIQEGNEMLSFGSAADPRGFIQDTVLDDAGSPYSQVITWTTNPWDRSNWDIRLRSGILDGITGVSGAGVYTERFFGTESILIGSLDKSGSYFEVDGANLNMVGDNVLVDISNFDLTASTDLHIKSDGQLIGLGYDSGEDEYTHLLDGANNEVSFSNGILTADNTEVGLASFTANSDYLTNGNLFIGNENYPTQSDRVVLAHRSDGISEFSMRSGGATTILMHAGGGIDGARFRNSDNENVARFGAENYIAGIDFDNDGLSTGDGSIGSYAAGTVTGIQPRSSATTKTFFSGADDKDGTNAKWFVSEGIMSLRQSDADKESMRYELFGDLPKSSELDLRNEDINDETKYTATVNNSYTGGETQSYLPAQESENDYFVQGRQDENEEITYNFDVRLQAYDGSSWVTLELRTHTETTSTGTGYEEIVGNSIDLLLPGTRYEKLRFEVTLDGTSSDGIPSITPELRNGALRIRYNYTKNITTQSGMAVHRAADIGFYVFTNDDKDMVEIQGELDVPGDITGGTKSFKIPHPDPALSDTHNLYHRTVESPNEGDNLYRYTIEATEQDQVVEKELPDYFKYLNKNPQAWITAQSSNDIAYDIEFNGNIVTFTCPRAGTYNILIIGTRKDTQAIESWEGAVRER